MADRIVGTELQHAWFGSPDCCGRLNGIVQGAKAMIVCNECLAVVRTAAAADLTLLLEQMELSLDASMAHCPYCGFMNLFPALSEVRAFTCKRCRRGVQQSEYLQ